MSNDVNLTNPFNNKMRIKDMSTIIKCLNETKRRIIEEKSLLKRTVDVLTNGEFMFYDRITLGDVKDKITDNQPIYEEVLQEYYNIN